MRVLISLLAATLLPLSPALAKGGGETAGYTEDIERRCQVWAPSMLVPYDYALRYTGNCKNGRAEGKGKAEWLYRYAEMKVKATWEGEFRNGVFLDAQKIKGSVEPLRGDKYIVAMGSVPGADLYFISRSQQDGPMTLCRLDQMALVLERDVEASDDVVVQRIMVDGAKAFQSACPGESSPNIGIFTETIRPQPSGGLPYPVARARYDNATNRLSSYNNDAAEKVRQARQQAEYAQKQEAARQKFDAFTSKHGIGVWLTARQLQENPFRWEGKTVGLVVRLERMLTPDTALIRSGFRDWDAWMQLTGVTPDFPESRHSVLLAAKVGTRQRLVDTTNSDAPTYVTLTHIDSRVCEHDGCSDWLNWPRGNNKLVWGEPYQPR